ncbi:MAG: hypothetical protein BIFFINMI_01037 [Phycisphaerae bacterium]|nr:hypothetical protein [Phycisphaerae bacterium]
MIQRTAFGAAWRLLAAAAVLPAAAAAAKAPSFTRPPAATREGDAIRIDFAVDRATDVAVSIESADGRVVRHLVAGVLGKNPPPPLKPDSLAQSIRWDGLADYGKPAGAGPFTVRVALGLGAKYDSIIAEDPQNFGNIHSLAVGPDGTLYVCAGVGAAVANWTGERIVALDRDGRYRSTVAPFPAGLGKQRLEGLGVVDVGGESVPLIKDLSRRSFYGSESARKSGMAVTRDGVLVRPVGGYDGRGPLCLSALDSQGTPPWGSDVGPPLVKMTRPFFRRPFVCISADGRSAYVTGMGQVRPDKKPQRLSFASVYRVPLPDRGPATPLFGEPEQAGNDDTHLSDDPRGLATDGHGHLLVADCGNNRVVAINESDGKLVGQFPIERPDHVAVEPGSGVVYVTRLLAAGAIELVKLDGWKDHKELAKLRVERDGDPAQPWLMALDASAKPAVVWMGSDGGTLLRIEDGGDRLTATKVNKERFGACGFVDMSVDRFRASPEIYARIGPGRWMRFSEGDGKIEDVSTGTKVNAGVCIVPAPDGCLYGLGWPCYFYKWDRNGKPVAWAKPDHRTAKSDGAPGNSWSANASFVPVSMVFMTHFLGVRHDGHLFVLEPGAMGGRPCKMLREYTPDGDRVSDTPIIWKVSDAAIGPRFDPQGNIYIAEQVKPADQVYPPEFAATVGKVELGKTYLKDDAVKDQVCTMYGSIVKFSPRGGMVHFGARLYHPATDPYKGEPKLDPSLKTVDAAYYAGGRLQPVQVTGAQWIRMGISHVGLIYCSCENTRFDVDDFGRVWYPDLGRFRVGVLDTNGNDLTHFGGYGNADNRGPDSGDKSLSQPDIPLAWLVGVAATDRYAYMGDSMSRRLIRARLVYAAEATCAVK